MASTTNYSWSTPDDTALVKDGAAAIRSLGSAIDSTVFTNASAAINKTIVDAKGDIIAATAADTVARLASSGVNNQVLTVDTSTATGLKWAAVSAGPTQLATASLAGVSTYTFSSISGAYKDLFLELTDSYDGNAATIKIQLNGSSSTNYDRTRLSSNTATINNAPSETAWSICTNGAGTSNKISFGFTFPQYAKTNTLKRFYGSSANYNGPGVWNIGMNTLDAIRDAAITSITVSNSGVNWTAGTLTIYGVN